MRHLLAVAGGRQGAGDKVVEGIDIGAENDIHQWESGARGDHAEEGKGVDDPSLGVIVLEDALVEVSELPCLRKGKQAMLTK